MEHNVFKELSRAKIQDTRSLVVSSNSITSGFTIAQQLSVQEGNRKIEIFLKGAIHIDSIDGLIELRDALNEAIEKES